MAPTKSHVERVLNVSGHSFIEPGDVPHLGARYTESYLRRRLFDVEDNAVVKQYNAYVAAWKDLRRVAFDLADRHGVGGTLGMDTASMAWRREMIEQVAQRMNHLTDTIGLIGFQTSVLAYLVRFYGELWSLDVTTREDLEIRVPNLDENEVSRRVVSQPFYEAHPDVGNDLIFELMGQDWRDQYGAEVGDVVRRIRRTLNRSLTEEADIRGTMRRVADELGVVTDHRRATVPNVRQNFRKVEVITRSFVNNNANTASLNAYEANADVIGGVQFVPANDSRVCPKCERYRGQQWPLGSIDIVRPVLDTHPNCRCSLVPVVLEETLVPADEIPRQSFSEWATAFGVGVLMDQFIRGRALDSTRD